MKRGSKIVMGLIGLFALGYWAYSVGKTNHFSERNFSSSLGKNGVAETLFMPPLTVAADGFLGIVSNLVSNNGSSKLERIADGSVCDAESVVEPVYRVREDSTVENKSDVRITEPEKMDDRIVEGAMAALGRLKPSDAGEEQRTAEVKDAGVKSVDEERRTAEEVRPVEVQSVHEVKSVSDVKSDCRTIIPKGTILVGERDVLENGVKVHYCDAKFPDPLSIDQCFAKIDPYLRSLPDKTFEYVGADRCNQTVSRAFFKGVPGLSRSVRRQYVRDCARFLCQPAYYNVTQEGDKTIIKASWH